LQWKPHQLKKSFDLLCAHTLRPFLVRVALMESDEMELLREGLVRHTGVATSCFLHMPGPIIVVIKYVCAAVVFAYEKKFIVAAWLRAVASRCRSRRTHTFANA